jgi:LysM repeat protein
MKVRLHHQLLIVLLGSSLSLSMPAAAAPAAVRSWLPAEPYWLAAPKSLAESPAGAASATAANAGLQRYVVQAGDSLSMIAQRFGISTDSLAAANNITDRNAIRVGQSLVVPTAGWLPSGTPSPVPTRTAMASATRTNTPAVTAEPLYYTVQPGDSISLIAQKFGVTSDSLAEANDIVDRNKIRTGQRLLIPGRQGNSVAVAATPKASTRGTLTDRLPSVARRASASSPLYRTTWLTYYGSPGVAVMGILGEFSIDELVPKLRAQAAAYDAVNGPDLGVRPAFHLIYGTATRAAGPNRTYLAYLSEDLIKRYIERAQKENYGVILDVQIGNVTPLAAIKPAFKFLGYPLVELALDPEFAMVKAGQTVPGDPPGSITAAQVNEVQDAMLQYMADQRITEHKMLIVHQFLPSMIINKDQIAGHNEIDVVICADGFGPPWPKISKYNDFMEEVQFAGFKLFYRWDEPLMNERQTMGLDPYPGTGYMEITPSLVVYQ